MATNTNEIEMLRKAIKLLHSPHPNSATELRMMLDEAIKQRYGPELMLSNNMSKRLMEEEANFPGRAATPPPQPEQPPSTEQQMQDAGADEVINLTSSPAKTISDSPDTIMDSDDGANVGGHSSNLLAGGDDVVNLKEFGDLNCAVCGEMVFTATNRLIECSACGTLYHQECHKPAITDEEASEGQAHNWQCDNCLSKPSTSKAAGVIIDEPIPLLSSKAKSSATSSRSSSTSNSSSPYPVIQQDVPTTSSPAAASAIVVQTTSSSSSSSTSRHHHHKSSRSSHKEERPSSSSSKSAASSSSVMNPTFNVVSASERSSSSSHSSKKSSHSSSSTGKSSSSSKSSSSKHHESSKRKGK
ncbi:integrator complex subunit 12 [Eurosta solidaginis]|uniref:integrator complex subunit 12 n=1 Tax=Eurosta solidaginis TaxID=178769 RepID=UPI0035315161